MARTWRVTDQEEGQVRVGSRYVPGVVVSYTDSTGLTGKVEVPLDSYKAETVRKLITDRVADHEAVAGLGSAPAAS